MQQPEIQMPNNPEIEASLLSALLGDRESVMEASKILKPEHFYAKKNELVYKSLLVLARDNKPIDALMAVEVLKAKGKLEDAGGAKRFFELMDIPPAGDPVSYAEKIRDYYIKRQIIEQAHTLIKRASNGEPADETLRYAQDQISSLTRHGIEFEPRGVHISNVYTADRMIKEYQLYLANLKNNRFVTGIHEIDKRIRGVAGGEVMTIIARAGSFKTALLQNLLLNYVHNSAWGAIFFSLEMPVANVTERFFSILDGCSAREVERQFVENSHEEWARKSVEQFKRDMHNLFVITTKISLEDIPQYVRMIEQDTGLKIGLVGIDYMGLMDGPGDGEYEIVSRIARGTKSIAKAINLPIVVLSQVSRKGGDGEVEVSLDMGRGSGAIEEGCDFCIGLWQQEKACAMGEAQFDLVARILKNRKGPKGSRWVLDLDAQALKFSGAAVEYVAPKKSRRKRCET